MDAADESSKIDSSENAEAIETGARFDPWKALRIGAVALLGGFALWRLAKVGFDWRAVLDDASPWSFFLAMSALPVFGFPISACYIYAGLAFEPIEAIAACLGALVVNLSASYVLARSVFRKPIERLIRKRGWTLPQMKEENRFRFAFAMRTIPGPPFFFQNLALSLVGLSFASYLWISLLTQGAISVVVVLGSREISRDPGSVTSRGIIVILGALLVAKAIRAIVAKRKRAADAKTPS